MRSGEESAETSHSKPWEGARTQGREGGRRLGVPRGREGPGSPTGLSKQQSRGPWALDSNRGAGQVLEGTQLSQLLCKGVSCRAGKTQGGCVPTNNK